MTREAKEAAERLLVEHGHLMNVPLPCDIEIVARFVLEALNDLEWIRAAVTTNQDVCKDCAAEICRACGWEVDDAG